MDIQLKILGCILKIIMRWGMQQRELHGSFVIISGYSYLIEL